MLSKQNPALIRAKLLLICWGFVAHTWATGLEVGGDFGVGEDFGKRGSDAEAGSGFGLVVVLSNKDAEAIEYFFPISTERGSKTLCKIKAIQTKKTATKSTNRSTSFGKASIYNADLTLTAPTPATTVSTSFTPAENSTWSPANERGSFSEVEKFYYKTSPIE